MKYVIGLRRDGELSDDDFGKIMHIVSAAFIEAEVSEKVESALGSALERYLSSVWQ